MANVSTVNGAGEDTVSVMQGDKEMPELKQFGQTPISSNSGKRLCAVLSPLAENEDDTLMSRIETMIEKALATHIPKLVDQLKSTIEQSVKTLIDQQMNAFKEEIQKELEDSERHTALRIKCESEALETYNRRENIRILGVQSSEEYEDNKVTQAKVLEIAKAIEADVVEADISIAHRLPSKKQGSKPIIVRFARRIARVNILKNKRKLQDVGSKQIRVFEDLTTARIRFFNMMRADTRINNVWTRDGAIHYIWKEDNR